MKEFAKYALKVLLAAMVASMTVTGAFALEAEYVETAQEFSGTAVSLAYYAEDETVALGASESTVLSFDNEITAVNLGTTEALLTYSEDNKSVTIEGVGYAGVVTAMDGTQTKSVSFYSGTKFKPGLNILTGTTDPIHYSDLGDKASTILPGTYENYTAGDDTRLARKFSGQWGSTQIANCSALDTRPLEIKLQYAGICQGLWASLPKADWKAYHYFQNDGLKEYTAWTDASYSGFCDVCKGTSACDHTDIRVATNQTGSGAAYIDSVSVIPYYKVTYKNVDGTDLKVEYVLKDSDGNYMTDYTVNSSVKPEAGDVQGFVKFVGWSLEENGEVLSSAVPLNNSDISLYPVVQTILTFDAVDAASATEKTFDLSVLAEYGYDLSSVKVDTGLTEATAKVNGNTFTVTPSGYAGVVLVSVKDGDGNVNTGSIRLYAGTKSRPGLNIFTGTEKAMSISEVKSLVAEDNFGLRLSNMAFEKKQPVAEKDGRLAVPADMTHILNTSDFTPERPLDISFEYCGYAKGRLWMIMPNEGWQIFYKVFDGDKTVDSWTKSNYSGLCGHCNGVESENAHKDLVLASDNNAGLMYIDALNITPYYKVTYLAADNTETIIYVDGKSTEYTIDASVLGSDFYTVEGSNEVYAAGTAIPLSYKDVVITAFAPEEPKTSDKNSIRANTEKGAGIRFGGFVSMATHNVASEYGFLVARADNGIDEATADEFLVLPDDFGDTGSLNFSGTTDNEVAIKFAGGRNYIKGGSSNKFAITDDGETPFGSYGKPGAYFTAVLVGLDKPYTSRGVTYATRYRVPIVARSYAKVGSIYYYGESKVASMKDVAARLLENENASEEEKQFAQDILDKAELTVE